MSPDTSFGLPATGVPIVPDFTGIRSRVKTVTPERAQQWLDNTPHLRTVPPRLIQSYSRDMKAGTWKLNAAPLIFSDDCTLLDGQVRLMACINANASFRSLIIEGIDQRCFLSLDAGYPRSFTSFLSIRHEMCSFVLGTTLRVLHQYFFSLNGKSRYRPSSSELLYMLDARPELRQAAAFANSYHGFLTPGVAGALYHLGCRVDENMTRSFFREFNDCKNADPSHPAVLLRQTLSAMSQRARHQFRTWMLAVAIKAWNAMRTRVPLSRLDWRLENLNESVPVINGLPANDGHDLIGDASKAEYFLINGDDIRVSVEIVTRDVARRLLENNPCNRKPRAEIVARYRRDMEEGRWWLNGQTIKIGRSGRLLDGQHRCRAGVDSGVAFPAIIVWGVDDSAFDTLDVGYSRCFNQILRSMGEPNASALAAALRRLYIQYHENRRAVPSHAELLALYHRFPEIRKGAGRLANLLKPMLEPSATIALNFAFSQEDPVRAEAFIQSLADGACLDKNSPILLLRNRLLEGCHSGTGRRSLNEKMALSIKAWRAFVAGNPLRALRWVEGRDPFPKFRWLPDDTASSSPQVDVEDDMAALE